MTVAMRILAASALLPAAAVFAFFVFWRWFARWRRRRVASHALMLGSVVALGAGIYAFRGLVLAPRVAFPWWVQVIGGGVIAAACALGLVADRQLGFRVRSFAPFFEARGRIELVTTGAYGIVRHPIYAAGIGYQLGVFLVTGFASVAVACIVFAAGAAWFTRQEERRLVELLDDPTEYDRYRDRVPRLLPRLRRRRG